MSKSNPDSDQKNEQSFRKLATTTYQPATAVTAPTLKPRQTIAEKDKKNGKRLHWKKALVALVLMLFIPLATIGVWNLINFSNASQKLFESKNIWHVLLPTPLESTGDGRVNILLVGYSNDNPGHAGADLTDSIMILSLHKKDRTGYMLSIPRDLYVDIPGNGRAKINEAYQYGERTGFSDPDYTAGGIGLLENVLDDHLDIDIHYYALVNYAAVQDTANALGGVTVNIESSDERGLYDPNFRPTEGGPLRLENGRNKIDGQTALKLTRARGATYGSYGFPQSDFNRTQNQQKVLAAIKEELTWRLILNPYKNGKIFSAAGENIETDVKLSEILPLYRLFNRVPAEDLKPISLNNFNGQNLLAGYTTPSGQSALIPAAGMDDFNQVRSAIRQLEQ